MRGMGGNRYNPLSRGNGAGPKFPSINPGGAGSSPWAPPLPSGRAKGQGPFPRGGGGPRGAFNRGGGGGGGMGMAMGMGRGNRGGFQQGYESWS